MLSVAVAMLTHSASETIWETVAGELTQHTVSDGVRWAGNVLRRHNIGKLNDRTQAVISFRSPHRKWRRGVFVDYALAILPKPQLDYNIALLIARLAADKYAEELSGRTRP